MGRQVGRRWMLGAAVLASGFFACRSAMAVTFEDIAGKWCTGGGSEQFNRDNLIAVITSTGEQHVFAIVSYDFTGTQATVTWKDAKGGTVHTDFAEFSGDDRRMVQLGTEKTPRRELHRC